MGISEWLEDLGARARERKLRRHEARHKLLLAEKDDLARSLDDVKIHLENQRTRQEIRRLEREAREASRNV